MEKTQSFLRGGLRLVCGLTLILASAAPVLTVSAAEAPASQLKIVHKGIPHDALYGLNIVGKAGLAVGGAGAILQTTDGGATWANMESPTQLGLFGIAINGDRRLLVGQRGTVLTNEGDKWVAAKSDSEARLLNVDLNAAGLAIAVGEFGTILRSKDAGKTWEKRVVNWASFRDDGYEPHIYAVDVQETGRIIIAAEFAYVLISDDGGETFTLTNKGERSLFALHMLPNGTGYVAGQEGMVLKTTDNGSTWLPLKSETTANLFGIWASPQGEIVATGMRALLRSSDAGATFKRSLDIDILRNWYLPVAMGELEEKGEGGGMVSQAVYIAGHDGVIAQVLQ